MWIGWDSHLTQNAWKGRIDDVRIYSYALAAEQVRALYEGKETLQDKD